ncbi:DUF1214 domain-containing protein [Cupriavidus basilensis]
MTFAKADLPAGHVKYFWSVIAVDSSDFRVIPNPRNRFLINKQSRLSYGKDGSLTLYFAPSRPDGAPDGNWLPTPRGQGYNLTFRLYGPDQAILSGEWFPAPLVRQTEPPRGEQAPDSQEPGLAPAAYAHEDVHDACVAKFAAGAASCRSATALPRVQPGRMIDEAAMAKALHKLLPVLLKVFRGRKPQARVTLAIRPLRMAQLTLGQRFISACVMIFDREYNQHATQD